MIPSKQLKTNLSYDILSNNYDFIKGHKFLSNNKNIISIENLVTNIQNVSKSTEIFYKIIVNNDIILDVLMNKNISQLYINISSYIQNNMIDNFQTVLNSSSNIILDQNQEFNLISSIRIKNQLQNYLNKIIEKITYVSDHIQISKYYYIYRNL